VDECKIRPKGVKRSSKNGKGATGLPVGFPLGVLDDNTDGIILICKIKGIYPVPLGLEGLIA